LDDPADLIVGISDVAREDLRLEPGLAITALVKASAIRLSPGPLEA